MSTTKSRGTLPAGRSVDALPAAVDRIAGRDPPHRTRYPVAPVKGQKKDSE